MRLLEHLNTLVPVIAKRPSFFKVSGLFSHFVHPVEEEVQALTPLASLKRTVTLEQRVSSSRSITLTFASIALAAKLAKIDAPINKEEIEAFYQYFPMPRDSKDFAAELFYEAHEDPADSRLYARKITAFYGDNPAVLLEVVISLLHLAVADGPINLQEYHWLKKTADALYFSDESFSQTLRHFFLPPATCPYQLLGVPRNASEEMVKQAYRRVVKDYHPDILASRNVPKEIQKILQEKFSRYTVAYEAIGKKRKFK